MGATCRPHETTALLLLPHRHPRVQIALSMKRPLSLHLGIAVLTVLGSIGCWAGAAREKREPYAEWDNALLDVSVQGVSIRSQDIISAWEAMGRNYLLRANLYVDAYSAADAVPFNIRTNSIALGELLKAFLSTYPDYTCSQDKSTGVRWIHRKSLLLEHILSQQVIVPRAAPQVPMYIGIFEPVLRALGPDSGIIVEENGARTDSTLDYAVDLDPGVYSVRHVLNRCCSTKPSQAFSFVGVAGIGVRARALNLYYDDPLAPARGAAVRFWEIAIGQPKGGLPTPDEVASALSDPDPNVRSAAIRYLDMTKFSFNRHDLLVTNTPEEQRRAAWALLAIRTLNFMPFNYPTAPVISGNAVVMQSLTNGLAQSDPCLALLLSMEAAVERTNASPMDVVVSHKFSARESAIVKPDVIRIARLSSIVREKLTAISFDNPTLSPSMLLDLANTNLLSLLPEVQK
jgi:hypothetical protein